MSSGSTPTAGFSLSSSYGRRAIALSIAAAVGGFLFGFDSSVINGAVDSIESDFALNDVITGFVVAIALLGCAFGAILAGTLSDRFGRLKVMLIGAVMFLTSAFGSGLAFGVWDLTFWRLIGGIGIGIASVVAPAYIAEVAPRQIRGTLGSLQQLAITLGIFAALLSDALLANIAGGANEPMWFGLDAWRWMLLVEAIPALVYGILALTMPESPRYLIARGRMDEAKEIFSRLMPPEDLEITVNELEKKIQADRKNAGVSLRGPVFGLQGIVWIGIILSVFQQFVGINVIFYYSNVLWQAVGFDESSSFTITVITSVTNIATTLIAIALIDKVGRKPLLLVGSTGMAVTLGTMAVIFGTAPLVDGQPQLGDVAGPVALIAANLFVVSFGMSWGPVVWVLLGEMFPNRIRAAALGLAAAGQWTANWLITVTFPGLRDVLGFAYGFYALCAVLSLLFVWRWVEETKGKTLEEMHNEAHVARPSPQ